MGAAQRCHHTKIETDARFLHYTLDKRYRIITCQMADLFISVANIYLINVKNEINCLNLTMKISERPQYDFVLLLLVTFNTLFTICSGVSID